MINKLINSINKFLYFKNPIPNGLDYLIDPVDNNNRRTRYMLPVYMDSSGYQDCGDKESPISSAVYQRLRNDAVLTAHCEVSDRSNRVELSSTVCRPVFSFYSSRDPII